MTTAGPAILAAMASHEHLPVLLEETMSWLSPAPGGDFVDCTIGRAGHASRILDLTSPDGRLLGLDADPNAIDSARVSLRAFAGRVFLAQSYSDELTSVAANDGFHAVDGILFDLGMSSPQVDDPDRGFSFERTGPLDMRMGDVELTAADIVNSAGERELTRIFREYGDERYAPRIARRIVRERVHSRLETTTDLARLVERAVPGPRRRIHPATRVFQALRIAVNDELGRLERALDASVPLLREGGRLVIISFHSLEDRIVKRFFRDEARTCICPPGQPVCTCGHMPRLRILTPKPVRPSPEEVASNPRSRSARLRAAQALVSEPA